MDYFDVLHKEFENESDRAAVILAASIADELLRSTLSARLVAVAGATDDLFDGANAPIGTFSARIELAFRIGLISSKFARDMHLIRRIRNEFAHNIQGCSFEDARVKSRVEELSNSHTMLMDAKGNKKKVSTRNQFLEAVSWMIWHLKELVTEIEAIHQESCEWGYQAPEPKKKAASATPKKQQAKSASKA
ncbi:MltR family transcriptional regulator [Geothrix oryzisoli]|uniref:MltR family transcriptional regulator n=1 Tax=Geothrix oryzisoli TaxID=2922721 RepID=UPI001FABF3C6|nr:MltR family transcriptional regulator [Geothrix oryzisoli]